MQPHHDSSDSVNASPAGGLTHSITKMRDVLLTMNTCSITTVGTSVCRSSLETGVGGDAFYMTVKLGARGRAREGGGQRAHRYEMCCRQ